MCICNDAQITHLEVQMNHLIAGFSENNSYSVSTKMQLGNGKVR